jgi:hypothetical protein
MRTRKHLVTQKQARVLGLDPESNLAAEMKISAPSDGTNRGEFHLEGPVKIVPILIPKAAFRAVQEG